MDEKRLTTTPQQPRAWRVEDIDNDGDDEFDFEVIVMATTRGQAKTLAMADPNFDGGGGSEGFQSLRATRAPEFDDGDLSQRNLIAHGWWYDCHGCYRRVSEAIAEDEGWTLAYDDAGRVYCGAACLEKRRKGAAS